MLPAGRHQGIKLHFANSGVDLRRTDHVSQLRQIFRARISKRMPIVVHLRRVKSLMPRNAEIFLHELVSQTPDIPIQIGTWLVGALDDATTKRRLFAEAIAKANPKIPHLYFDLTSIVFPGHPVKH